MRAMYFHCDSMMEFFYSYGIFFIAYSKFKVFFFKSYIFIISLFNILHFTFLFFFYFYLFCLSFRFPANFRLATAGSNSLLYLQTDHALSFLSKFINPQVTMAGSRQKLPDFEGFITLRATIYSSLISMAGTVSFPFYRTHPHVAHLPSSLYFLSRSGLTRSMIPLLDFMNSSTLATSRRIKRY